MAALISATGSDGAIASGDAEAVALRKSRDSSRWSSKPAENRREGMYGIPPTWRWNDSPLSSPDRQERMDQVMKKVCALASHIHAAMDHRLHRRLEEMVELG